jgi:hypothetical protein
VVESGAAVQWREQATPKAKPAFADGSTFRGLVRSRRSATTFVEIEMNRREIDQASSESARGGPLASRETHTKSGAPTDKAHLEAGDGSLLGSIPAGLSIEELQEIAESDQSVESGTS